MKENLHLFSMYGKDDETRALLERNRNGDVNATDTRGWTPLQYACDYGQTTIVEILIQYGVDVDKANRDGHTPLHLATRAGHPAIVRLLLEAGADPNIRDKDGRMALDLLPHNRPSREEIARLFSEHACNQNQYSPGV